MMQANSQRASQHHQVNGKDASGDAHAMSNTDHHSVAKHKKLFKNMQQMGNQSASMMAVSTGQSAAHQYH